MITTGAGAGAVFLSHNVDGRGTFGPREALVAVENPRLLRAVDLDRDGDQDLVVGQSYPSGAEPIVGLFWIPNVDGVFANERREIVSASVDDFFLVDIDGDQDLDVVSSAGRQLVWSEHLDGAGNFAPAQVIDEIRPWSIYARDLDDDNDTDLVVLTKDETALTTTIRMYFNINGKGSFEAGQPILEIVVPSKLFFSNDSVFAEDMNLDGDWDLVVKTADRVLYYERSLDEFGMPQLLEGVGLQQLADPANLQLDFHIRPEDFDDDGDVDIAVHDAHFDRLLFLENRLLGDANDDGRVEFADFLELSSNFGKQDQGWENGDFNGDEIVNFADFLILSSNFGAAR